MEDRRKKVAFLDKHPRVKKLVENEIADAMSLRVKMCWIVAIMWVLLQLALIKIIFLIINRAVTDAEIVKSIFTVLRDFYAYGNVVFLVWIIVYMLGKQNVHLKVLGIIELNISNSPNKDNPMQDQQPEQCLGPVDNDLIIPTGNARTGE